mmetsp:Transcript_13191/g.24783  ORF Transcript_13191/g.24783 Transcript_13191/m.24783 type:complete len:105 (+) Transcript_13191:441-755(+)
MMHPLVAVVAAPLPPRRPFFWHSEKADFVCSTLVVRKIKELHGKSFKQNFSRRKQQEQDKTRRFLCSLCQQHQQVDCRRMFMCWLFEAKQVLTRNDNKQSCKEN